MKKGSFGLAIIAFGIIASLFIVVKAPKNNTPGNLYEASFYQKIDLKALDNEVYGNLIGGKLEPVLETIKIIHQNNVWLEIVHLVVPGYTDNLEEIKQMCLWLKKNTSEDVPVHFSRFWPKYKLTNLPPTPEETIKKARQVCQQVGMKYVYTGNIED